MSIWELLHVFAISMMTVPLISRVRNGPVVRVVEVLPDCEICEFLKDYKTG